MPDKTKLTYMLNEKGIWKEYKEESAPHTVTNYNLSGFAFGDYGILNLLQQYMASTKGVFKYDEYVEYAQQALGDFEKNNLTAIIFGMVAI